jgi:hypothetical protein
MSFNKYLRDKENEENEEHRQFVLSTIPQGTVSSVHDEYSKHFKPPYESSSEDESDDGRKYGNGSKYRCLYDDTLMRYSEEKNKYVNCYAQTLKGQELREDPYDKKNGNTWVYSTCSKHCTNCLGCSPGCGKDTREIICTKDTIDWNALCRSLNKSVDKFVLAEKEELC